MTSWISCNRFAALVLVALPATCCHAGPQGVRFNSPGVLDLAEPAAAAQGARALAVAALDAVAAQQVLAAPTLDQAHATLTYSDHELTVQRSGKRIVIKPTDAAPVEFIDWVQPETKSADGDWEGHVDLGVLPGSGYRRVEVQFGHDAPGSFLVNPKSGKIAFVHNGSDIVALSPDGMRLLTFNPDNPPLSLRVAALDGAGPRVELQCIGASDKAAVQFKGWRDAQTFELVLTGSRPTPVRIAQNAGAWQIAIADAAIAPAITCRAAAP